AILYYTKNNDGKGYWGIDNDVSGWTESEKGERMLLGWGNASYQRGYSVVYMVLAQEALNDYENFVKAEQYIMLAKSYKNDLKKQEELYRKALEIQPINIDAWYGLIENYNANNAKTENDYYTLAEDLANKLMAFPLPMTHLLNLIKPKLTSVASVYQFTLLQTRTLTAASTLPNTATNIVLQPSVTRTEGNYLLGRFDKTIATFSFDGNDAGKIVLSSRFDGNGVRWDYSLDGKKTWHEVSFTGEEEHKLQLTPEEIDSITAENDIYVHIVGVNYDEENLYRIDIKTSKVSENVYANDLENRVVGVDLTYEWRNSEYDDWTSYKEASPNIVGNKKLYVRVGANGTYLPSDSVTYTFTEDNQPDTRKYIPVSHLSVHAVSTQATNNAGAATYAIDGNYNTRYHSAWNGTDTERYVVIKIDNPVYLSAVEFVPAGGGNGKIVDGTIYGSMDGENWTELTSKKGITYNPSHVDTIEQAVANTKSFDLPNSELVQYVKIKADKTNGNWFTAREFNLYQDITKIDTTIPTAEIAFSPAELTNGEVTARLVNPSRPITITNNDGKDTYIFTKNDEFTFEFVDKEGNKGTAVANVNWIDTKAPTGKVVYSTTAKTNKEVVATLTNISEDIYILDHNDKITEYVEVANGKVMYIAFYNANGDTTKIAYFNPGKNIANKIEYYKNSELFYVTDLNENGSITKETFYDEKGNIIENPTNIDEYRRYNQVSRSNPLETTFSTNGTYTYRIQDKAGNKSAITAKVENIDVSTPIATVIYDIDELTNKNVTARIILSKEDTTITNNNGKTTYTFTKNGEFTFNYKDAAGNTGKITAKVDWIDKTAPTAELKYDKSSKTKAVVKVVNPSESITYHAGNGVYEFTKNGRYQIAFYDKAGNAGTLIAVIDWLEEEEKPSTTNPETTTKPSGNTGNTTKPSTSGNTSTTTKPSGNTGNTTKPSTTTKPSSNTGSTTKPNTTTKPSGNTGNTTKPSTTTKPSNNTGNTTKPSTTTKPSNNTESTINPGTTTNPSGNTGNTTTPSETETTYKS
ncbi:MAG: discoidin domain-containing protein, partial [Bacilli bacterium]|nr:discoidin domain-containing protein [Bacilli bacterium]